MLGIHRKMSELSVIDKCYLIIKIKDWIDILGPEQYCRIKLQILDIKTVYIQ